MCTQGRLCCGVLRDMSDFLILPDIWVVERKNFLKQYYIVPQYLCKMQAMFANRVHDLASLLCVKVVNDNINGLSKDSAWTQHEDLERLFLCLSIPTRKTIFFSPSYLRQSRRKQLQPFSWKPSSCQYKSFLHFVFFLYGDAGFCSMLYILLVTYSLTSSTETWDVTTLK